MPVVPPLEIINNRRRRTPEYSSHEATIIGGGKTVHVVFNYLSRSLLYKEGGGAGGVTPIPSHHHPVSKLIHGCAWDISFKSK
jgi:hypothetical protein